MASAALQQETYLPDTGSEDLAEVHDFLAAHEAASGISPAPRYLLAGAAPGDQVEIPEGVYRALRQVVEAMRQGLAVTVVPQAQTLTSQQAAELLGVSRPTLVKLLDEQQIAYERVGSHRRVKLHDILAYRRRRRAEQYAALEVTAIDPDDEEDLDTTLQRLREARHAVADRRRGRGSV